MTMFRESVVLLSVCLMGAGSWGEFTLQEKPGTVVVLENALPVLEYHFDRVAPPSGVPDHFGRACYIHPLFGLSGEVITQDFPVDHYHHRGVFWAWPECKVGERRMDVWALTDVRPHHEAWVTRDAGKDKAEIAVRNRWAFDDAPDKAQVREEVRFTVWPAGDKGRALDFHLKLTNVSGEAVTFLGAKNKGYGGFCFRPDARNKPLTFTTATGALKEDALRCDTPWAGVSWQSATSGQTEGMAIFQHPSNPGYPFPGWIMRHYGFLGASWPHETVHTLQPGESFELRYRVVVHKGTADDAGVGKTFDAYLKAVGQ